MNAELIGLTYDGGTEIDVHANHYPQFREKANNQECKDLLGALIKRVDSHLQ